MSERRSESGDSGLNISLWCVQGLLSVTFAGTGIWKLLTPIADLASAMPWMGQVSPTFLYVTAVLDTLGGLGIVLPSVTRIKPGLTVVAAIGCALLMLGATIFHVSRGEADSTPFNLFLAVLALAVSWGRGRKVPIAPRA